MDQYLRDCGMPSPVVQAGHLQPLHMFLEYVTGSSATCTKRIHDRVLVAFADQQRRRRFPKSGRPLLRKARLPLRRVGSPGTDGEYTIRQSHNNCTPDCATGTITTQDLHWNGNDYVP